MRAWFKLTSGSQSCDGSASHSREGRGSSDTPSYWFLLSSKEEEPRRVKQRATKE